jgi:ABC-type glycerol-3-phosphate transport system permease component
VAAVVAVVSAFLSMLARLRALDLPLARRDAVFLFLLVGLVAPYEGMVIPLYYDLKASA